MLRAQHKRDDMHTGAQYHKFVLASQPDRTVRERFQKLVLDLLPKAATVLDFGAGTGIYLAQHCRDEIAQKAIVTVSSPLTCRVQTVTANFAVLNHFDDHRQLCEELSQVVRPGGFVLASMLNPYYLGDVRYGWWRSNIMNLLRRGHYAIASESRIHRFAPRVVAQAAAPYFRLERLLPRGLGMATQLYMFLLLRRISAPHDAVAEVRKTAAVGGSARPA